MFTPPGIPFSLERYFGTLTLAVRPPPDGCGTVTIRLLSPTRSGFVDDNNLDILPIDLQGLTIVLPPCEPSGIESSVPVRCSIDGRQGSEPDLSMPGGWTSIEVKLDVSDAAAALASDFTMREVPGGAIANPTTALVNTPSPGWVTLNFLPTNPGVWTCIKLKTDTDGEVCLGGLPGDADLSGVAEAADVPILVDCLAPALGEECALRECDMDRSGVCGASDLVRQLDLLNKAEGYADLDSALLECPNP